MTNPTERRSDEDEYRYLVDMAKLDLARCCWPDDGVLDGWSPCAEHAEFGNAIQHGFLTGRYALSETKLVTR